MYLKSRARCGLVVVGLAVLTGGCWSPPPTYEAEQRLPPFFITANVLPPPSVVHFVTRDEDDFHIVAPYRSRDLGEDLAATVVLDEAPGSPGRLLQSFRLTAGGYDDSVRFVDHEVEGLSLYPGCHTLTLRLVHVEEDDKDQENVARVSWLLAIEGGAEPSELRLRDCPTAGVATERE